MLTRTSSFFSRFIEAFSDQIEINHKHIANLKDVTRHDNPTIEISLEGLEL